MVFNFYINPETPTRKHGRVEPERASQRPACDSRPQLPIHVCAPVAPGEGLLVFVWLLVSSKDVVGGIACRPFDTTSFCLANNRVRACNPVNRSLSTCGRVLEINY